MYLNNGGHAIPEGERSVRALVKDRKLGWDVAIRLGGSDLYMNLTEARALRDALAAAIAHVEARNDAAHYDALVEDTARDLLADAQWRAARDAELDGEQEEPDYEDAR